MIGLLKHNFLTESVHHPILLIKFSSVSVKDGIGRKKHLVQFSTQISWMFESNIKTHLQLSDCMHARLCTLPHALSLVDSSCHYKAFGERLKYWRLRV
jgi:hypothetical protein